MTREARDLPAELREKDRRFLGIARNSEIDVGIFLPQSQTPQLIGSLLKRL
jgi:hypothetical protein